MILDNYNLNNLTQWSPPVTPPANSTNKITISGDSSLAIIETDNHNPLYIMNLTTYQIAYTIPIDLTIQYAQFLN